MKRLTVKIELDPFLGKVWVKLTHYRGYDAGLLRAYVHELEKASHLYTLKERIQKGYKLADCRHPRKRLKRRKDGTYCLKCGSRIKASQVKLRAMPIVEIKKVLAKAPTRRVLRAVPDLY